MSPEPEGKQSCALLKKSVLPVMGTVARMWLALSKCSLNCTSFEPIIRSQFCYQIFSGALGNSSFFSVFFIDSLGKKCILNFKQLPFANAFLAHIL